MKRHDSLCATSARTRAVAAPIALAAVLAIGAVVVAATGMLAVEDAASTTTTSSMNELQADDRAAVDHGAAQQHEPDIHLFNHRPIRPANTIIMRVTAYSPDEHSCGEWADGITASGFSVLTNAGNLVAADTSILPLGSLVSVPGYDHNRVVPVLDRGGAIKGNRLDVLFPTHDEAMEWGVRDLEVTIWEYADGQPNGFREQHRRW